jgi:hypothetical protein
MNCSSTVGNKITGKKEKRDMNVKCKLITNNHTEQTKHKCTQQHGTYCTVTKTTRANFRRSSRRFMSSCLNHRLLVTDSCAGFTLISYWSRLKHVLRRVLEFHFVSVGWRGVLQAAAEQASCSDVPTLRHSAIYDQYSTGFFTPSSLTTWIIFKCSVRTAQ